MFCAPSSITTPKLGSIGRRIESARPQLPQLSSHLEPHIVKATPRCPIQRGSLILVTSARVTEPELTLIFALTARQPDVYTDHAKFRTGPQFSDLLATDYLQLVSNAWADQSTATV